MSSSRFARLSGLGGVLAGLFWLVYILLDNATGGGLLFLGSAWDYVAAVAVAVIIFVSVTLFLQGDHTIIGKLGLVTLAIGSALLAVAALLYARQLDFEAGLAFTAFFFGTSIQGLGIALLGLASRSRGYFAGWSTVLLVFGIFLILDLPILMFLDFNNITIGETRVVDAIFAPMWVGVFVVQALSWMMLGVLAFTGSGEPSGGKVRTAR